MSELFITNQSGGNSDGNSATPIDSAVITLAENESFTYDGTEKIRTIVSVTLEGNTLVEGEDYVIFGNRATNAGTHTISVFGVMNYGGVATAEWSIAKKQGTIAVSSDSVAIVGSGSTETVNITKEGDGVISIESSNSSVATAAVSNDVITITSVAAGSATITVTMADGNNYLGSSDTIDVTVTLASSVLSENTPDVIQMIAQAGTGSDYWSVGDKTAAISIGAVGNMSATSARAFIIGFNHNSSKEGTGIHFQFGKTTNGTQIAFCDSGYNSSKTSGTWFNMNNSDSNSGGWSSSRMRTVICPAFLSALPSAWQNVIASTTKYSDNTGGGNNTASYVTTTSDKIFLLAEYEVQGARTYANSAEYTNGKQAQYAYYANGNSKIFYKHNATSTACYWWLRSVRASGSYSFCYVNTVGSADYTYAFNSFGFAPGFRVA